MQNLGWIESVYNCYHQFNDNIYLTASNYINKGVNTNDSKNNNINGKTIMIKDLSKNNKEKKLIINNMTLISDGSLVKKIKNEIWPSFRRCFGF